MFGQLLQKLNTPFNQVQQQALNVPKNQFKPILGGAISVNPMFGDQLLSAIGSTAKGLFNNYKQKMQTIPSNTAAGTIQQRPLVMPQVQGQNVAGMQLFNTPKPTNTPVPVATPQPTMTPQPTQLPSASPSYPNYTLENLKQGVTNTWGANTPLLENINDFYEAGLQMPKGIDPYLPTILALRETQGGKDNRKPNAKTGKNNYFNMSGGSGWANYPDVRTSIFGGGPQNQMGLMGVLNSPTYKQFRDTGDISHLWEHWSPPNDGNGVLDEQVKNYQWMRGRFK